MSNGCLNGVKNVGTGRIGVRTKIKLDPDHIRLEMNMRIIDSRNDHAPFKVDSTRRWAGRGENYLICSDGKDPIGPDRNCFNKWVSRAAGEHSTVQQHRIRSFRWHPA